DPTDNDDTKSSRGVEAFGLSKDQYEKLVNLLQTATIQPGASTSAQVNATAHDYSGNVCLTYSLSNFTYGSWIIDSGASDHICSNLAYFDCYRAIAPIQVKMPNGTTACAKVA
ncbi:putative retrovirus-like polyprotein, partial [Trifolium medium]|nr:putative retrovirus-like polyprotein [Trifolium medium]